MANRIQLRRGGAQEWANENPTLAQGELGIELDTNRFKIGDGVRGWNTLPYERPIESVANTANTLVSRDADGNFSAGAITATLIGNAATASRLANPRQIQMSGDLSGSGTFDGSQNLSLAAALQTLISLPHYDGTTTSSGQYTKVTVDAKGRITTGSQPSSYVDLGLTDVQPLDSDLTAIANLTTTGIVTRSSPGNMLTRSIQGSSGRISVVNGNAVAGNPTLDLIDTTIALETEWTNSAGQFNIPSLISVGGDNLPEAANRTVNSTRYTVDQYGRFTSALTIPIATAREGSKYPAYSGATAYNRYDIIEEGGNVYQAIADITAGQGAPSHTDSSDAGSWRYLAAAATEQKGLASFAQEDFDVDSNGHVTIAALGVDNTQLQNNRISFADENTKEDFELDQELTSTTGYRGFNYLNYVKVNDTSGNLLFGANNTGDGGAGEIDVNVRSYFSDPDITLDGVVAQTLDKTGDGDLTFQTTQNSASGRALSIRATNSGAGTSTINIVSEDKVNIQASDANGKVHVEDSRFQDNYIATAKTTMHLDPGDDRAVTGLVRVWGDLQVDGTTTTVNSTTVTIDDPVFTLGGDQTPTVDDNLDRGIEFKYYDTAAKLGFYGYDDSYTDLAGHVGGFSFLYDATNSSEVFSGTDAGLLAGNLKLTTNTNSTSNTTGDLVVAGGVGITQDVNIGGLVDIDSTLRVHSTSRFDDNMVIQGASKTLQLNNGSGTTRIELQSTTGNASFYGVVDITNDLNVNTNKFNVASASGNTLIAGTLGVTGGTTLTGGLDLNNTLNVSDFTYLESTAEPQIALNQSTGLYEIQNSDYGAFRFDGGGYIEGNFMFNSDVFINGQIVQKEDTTANYNRQNYLEVRYKFRTGTRAAYTPSYATDDTSNLRVYGGAGIATDLHIGDDLYIGKVNNGDTVEFQVLGESGNTTIGRSGQGTNAIGTLDVHGDVRFYRDLFSNGNVTLGDSTSDTLTVQANSEFNGTVDIDANFAVRTSGGVDKFTVASADGATEIEGLLTINNGFSVTNGTTNFSDIVRILDSADSTGVTNTSAALYVAGGLSLAKRANIGGQLLVEDSIYINSANEGLFIQNGSQVTKFSVDSDNGNTNIIGTLTVANAVDLNNTLNVAGITTLESTTQQTLTGTYGADGGFRCAPGAGFDRNVAIGGDLRVFGDIEITGATTQSGNTGFSGKVSITNTQDVTSFADSNVAFTVDGGARITKNQYVGGDFVVYDNAGAVNSFFVDVSTGNAELRNNMVIGGDLTVNGTTTTVNSTVVTIDDPIITLGGDTAPSSDDNKDRGVEFRYYDTQARLGFYGWDNNLEVFRFLRDATNNSEVFSGTDAALQAGSLRLTSTGTALDVDANANIDGTLTVDGQITSNVTSGSPLIINSTSKVNNLNADLLDGLDTSSTDTTGNSVVTRNSGNFSANQITVNNGIGGNAGIQGNATTADALRTARTITVDGVVDGSVSFNGSSNVTITTVFNDSDITALAAQTGTGLVARTATGVYAQRQVVVSGSGIGVSNADGVSGNPTISIASSSTNAANNLVIRDGSGNFSAGTITATLTGNVTGNLTGNASNATAVSTGSGGGTTMYLASFSGYGATSGRTIFANNNVVLSYSNPDWTLTVDKVASDLTGNVTGNVTGNLTGNVTGDVTGNLLGNVTGDVTGDLTGNVTGNLTGNVTGNATTVSVSQSGSVGDYFVGIVANSVGSGTSALRADSGMKFHTGTNVLTVTGGVTADLTGNVTGDLTGNVTGTVSTLSNHDTDDLAEGGNLYYTEQRVQDKLDNAFAQLSAMLNNLSTATTLTLNLNGDPTPGVVVTLGSITNNGLGGYTNGTNVATTGGSGTGLSVNTTTTNGAITGLAINQAGSQYAINDTITIVNPNAGGVASFNFATLSGGTGYATANNVATTTTGSGTNLTVNITASSGVITNVVVSNAGSGYAPGDTITIAGGGQSATIDVATVFENATFTLADITAMEVGATLTGSTSGSTGVITALTETSVTIDNVDGFFKVGEVVGANDVTTLTITSFS